MAFKITGFLNVDTQANDHIVDNVQRAGSSCRTPGGKKVDPPHMDRLSLYVNHADFKLTDYLHRNGKAKTK